MLAAIYPQSRAEVLYYPVVAPTDRSSKEERRAIRAEFETSFDATVIVQVSRMEGLKGHTPHLEALGGMKNLPGWVCWLVGGPQRPQEVAYNNELRALAESLGISERVRFIGERSDVTKVLDAADIYCQPNLRPDAFGISFIEAFDAGLPVVTSNLGGALEVVTDSCGILVPPGDVTALADVLRKLINDEGLRRTLGATGRTRARKLCDPNTQLRKLYELLSSVMKRDQYLNQG
jgi:glycosyltransferase involved in cell wall biosynthesis